jgi:hypothetical protein
MDYTTKGRVIDYQELSSVVLSVVFLLILAFNW